MKIYAAKETPYGIVFNKLSMPVKYFSPSKYLKDSPCFNNHREIKNEQFKNSKLENAFEIMDYHAKNGFGNLLRHEQNELISRMRKYVKLSIIVHGNFTADEFRQLIDQCNKRINTIYRPFMKQRGEKIKKHNSSLDVY